MYETEIVSSCCKAPVTTEKGRGKAAYRCTKCEMKCYTEERCTICHGTGEVAVLGQVYPNEPHMADVGTRPCLCKKNNN